MFIRGLGDPAYQTLNTQGLPSCMSASAQPAGSTPCKAPDGTILYLFASCDQVSPGTPCYMIVDQADPSAGDAPPGAGIETIATTPGSILDPNAQAVADRAKQLATLKRWGTALAVGLGAGLLLYKVRG